MSNEILLQEDLMPVKDQHGADTTFETMPIALTAEKKFERQETLSKIAKLNPESGTKVLGIQYWNAREGDELQGKFIGWTLFNQKDDEGVIKQKPTALIDTIEGTYGCNTIQFIEKMKMVPIDAPVYIKCTLAKPKTMKEYDIRDLSKAN